ncbi:cyclophilin-like fold protein [Streptosporangium sp. NPDC001559]|uniref:cyclophilin-like fold protein n=1 Tax=Streptosporangium sp. NPDC001559 TaxID=3366187 RepID=UPI0036EFEDC9
MPPETEEQLLSPRRTGRTWADEEFSGREKIGCLRRKLDTTGSLGSDPEDGDLIYFVPWGDIGFHYDAAGIGHSDQVIHLGAYRAALDQLTKPEGDDVTVVLAG